MKEFYAASREIHRPAASGVISNQKGNGDNAPLLYTCSLFPTLGQKPTFCPEITKNLMFEKCDFYEKWDFENVNFGKKMTLWNSEFGKNDT